MNHPMYSVTFFLEVSTGGGNGRDVRVDDVRVPFVPSVGMMVLAVRGDNYREVEQVFWTREEIAGLPHFECFLKFEERSGVFKKLIQLGWRPAD